MVVVSNRAPARVQTNSEILFPEGSPAWAKSQEQVRAFLNLPFVNCYFGEERGQKAAALFFIFYFRRRFVRWRSAAGAVGLVLGPSLMFCMRPFNFSRTWLFYYSEQISMLKQKHTKGRETQAEWVWVTPA
jgi:hypothetical protein